MEDQILLEQLSLSVLRTISDGQYSLKKICSALYLSRSQLHRRVKKMTGMSTTLYIRKIRLEKAKELLLADTGAKISDIAIMVGINSAQNFSKYFKQQYGVTPSHFKKMNQRAYKNEQASSIDLNPSAGHGKQDFGTVL